MSKEGGLIGSTLGRMRHPWLFALAAAALAVDLVVPDIVPFVDEVLLAAGAAGLAMLRKRREEKTSPGEAEPADETTTG